jgi:hypothetical protein
MIVEPYRLDNLWCLAQILAGIVLGEFSVPQAQRPLPQSARYKSFWELKKVNADEA